jgi:hypothetical protein
MEPVSPLRQPEKLGPAENPLGQAERTGDSHGQNFRFWGKPGQAKSRNQPIPAAATSEEDAVSLNLSSTAKQALARRKRKDQ